MNMVGSHRVVRNYVMVFQVKIGDPLNFRVEVFIKVS